MTSDIFVVLLLYFFVLKPFQINSDLKNDFCLLDLILETF